MTGEQIHELLNELDTNHNGQVEVEEYLQVRLQMWQIAWIDVLLAFSRNSVDCCLELHKQ